MFGEQEQVEKDNAKGAEPNAEEKEGEGELGKAPGGAAAEA